ncbi:MAG: metal ABC transporter ATP-binding protein [bacterium]
MKSVLSAQHVSFHYGGSEVVNDVSFDVQEGDYVALVGHNGSGKSTLLKLFLNLLVPSKGKITLWGVPSGTFSDWKRIGYLPQNVQLFNPLFPATVREVVALGLLSQKQFPKRMTSNDAEKVYDALKQMHILPLADKLVGELSGGQMQRTLLARAIVHSPQLLFLDEPVSAIDTETRNDFFTYTGELNKKQKTTIILVTHDIEHSGGFANKMLYLDKKILFYGNFKQLCVSPHMKQHLGEEIQHIMCHQH